MSAIGDETAALLNRVMDCYADAVACIMVETFIPGAERRAQREVFALVSDLVRSVVPADKCGPTAPMTDLS